MNEIDEAVFYLKAAALLLKRIQKEKKILEYDDVAAVLVLVKNSQELLERNNENLQHLNHCQGDHLT